MEKGLRPHRTLASWSVPHIAEFGFARYSPSLANTIVQPKVIAHQTTADEARNRETGCLG
jgi:hypothetical protein